MQESEKFKQLLIKISELFHKYGLRSISMDDIARELGISKKTLYSYVSNKAELIEAVMDNNRDLICNSMEVVRDPNQNAIDELMAISSAVNMHHDTFNTVMIFDLEKFYPELFAKYKEDKIRQVHRFISDNLRKGIAEGLYREDLDIDLIARLYIRKMENVRDENFFKDHNVSLQHLFEVMFENHIRGISNQDGIEYFENIKHKYQIHP